MEPAKVSSLKTPDPTPTPQTQEPRILVVGSGSFRSLERSHGAGEGNRTLMTSLEGWGSAIELRPRVPVEGVSATG